MLLNSFEKKSGVKTISSFLPPYIYCRYNVKLKQLINLIPGALYTCICIESAYFIFEKWDFVDPEIGIDNLGWSFMQIHVQKTGRPFVLSLRPLGFLLTIIFLIQLIFRLVDTGDSSIFFQTNILNRFLLFIMQTTTYISVLLVFFASLIW